MENNNIFVLSEATIDADAQCGTQSVQCDCNCSDCGSDCSCGDY